MKKYKKKKVIGFVGAVSIAVGFGLVAYEATTGFRHVGQLPEQIFFLDATPDHVEAPQPQIESMDDFLKWAAEHQPDPRSTISGHYLSSRFAASINDIQRAAIEVSRGLDLEPENGILINRAFSALLLAGEVEQAIELAYAVDPYSPLVSHLSITLQLADALKTGDIDTAQALVDTYKMSGFGEYLKPLAQAWIDVMSGQGDAAIKSLKDMAKKAGQLRVLYEMHLAFVYDYLGDKTSAQDYYTKIFKENKSIRTGWISSRFLLKNSRKEEALKVLSEIQTDAKLSAFVPYAIENARSVNVETLEPYIQTPADGFMAAIFDLASVLKQENSGHLSLLYARIAEYIDSSDPFINLLIADIQEENGLDQDALSYYAQFKEESDFYIMSTIRQAELLEEQGTYDKAIAKLQSLSGHKAVFAKVMMSLGDLYRRSGQLTKAIETYSKIISEEEQAGEELKNWVVYYARGMSFEQDGQWDKAEKDLLMALSLSPDQPYVLNYLGYSWADKGINEKQALAYIQKAMAQNPYDGYIVDSMGWALYRLGRHAEAVPYIERAIQLIPNDPIINDHLGDVYWYVGRKIEAIYQWQRALKMTKEVADKEKIEKKILSGLGPKGFEIGTYAVINSDQNDQGKQRE